MTLLSVHKYELEAEQFNYIEGKNFGTLSDLFLDFGSLYSPNSSSITSRTDFEATKAPVTLFSS